MNSNNEVIPNDNVKLDDNVKLEQQKRKEYYELHIKNLKTIILRQTDYSEEEAIIKLKEHNNNAMNVIREYIGSFPNKSVKPYKSDNQKIYAEMRGMLDTAARNYRIKKENEEKKEFLKHQFNAAKNNSE